MSAGSLAPAAKTLLAMRTVIGGGVQTAELAAKGMQALSARLEKAGINDADVSSLIARTQTFVKAHPAEIASLAYGTSAAKGLGIAGVSDYVNLHGLYTSRVEAPHPLDTPARPVADSKARSGRGLVHQPAQSVTGPVVFSEALLPPAVRL